MFLNYPMLLINSLIDKGATEEIDVIVEKCKDGTLFDYLADKYKDEELKTFARREEADEYLKTFFENYIESDFSRKFMVQNNGLNLLIASMLSS